jgi:carboxyl-terminal processing protease
MNKLIICLSALCLGQSAFGQLHGAPKQTYGQRLDEILMYIDKQYVDSVNTDKLMNAAVSGMLEELDPHSTFISAEEVNDAKSSIEGSFVGVGIRFQILKDTLVVVEAIPGGPSEKLGIRAGDKIISIEGQNVAGVGLKNSQVREKLLGDIGTKVRVDIKRKGAKEPMNFVITRNNIPVNSVQAAYMVTPKIGYIKLTSFSRNSYQEVTKGIKDLKDQGMESLVLDLQGNPGGLLNIAEYISDEFLSGDKLIVYSEGRSQPRIDLNAKNKGSWETGKLVILTDENSASASEIVSGAIQDWDRGLIVGRRTYGKGLVQRPIDLTDGSQIRLTIARYFTPSGRFIQKPYDDLEEYRNDYMRRFMNGEMTNIDSIKLPDSLKFETRLTRRTVYGGGGIMPDVFVPLDTTEITDIYRDISATGAFNTFTLDYVDRNRDELNRKYETLESFIAGFKVDEKFKKEFLDYVKKEDREFKMNDAQYKTSESLINLRLKATIAQDLFGTKAFYEIFNEKNEILQRAIKVLQGNEYANQKLASSL